VGCSNVCLAPAGIAGGESVGTIGDVRTIGVGDQVPEGPYGPYVVGVTGAAKPPGFLGRDTKRPLPCPAGYQHPAAVQPQSRFRPSPRCIARQRLPHLGPGQAELPGDLRWLDAQSANTSMAASAARRVEQANPIKEGSL
jgi:hypothetical protein